MNKALLVLLLASPLACAAGEIAAGGGPGTDAAGSTSPSFGAAGMGGVTGSAGSTASTGAAGVLGAGNAGSGATAGVAGSLAPQGSGGAAGNASGCASGVIPADVAAVISSRCVACHGNPPIQGVPTALTTYAQLAAPSKSDPTKSVAALALLRMQGGAMPMPPAPLARATTAEVDAFQRWVSAGLSKGDCADAGVMADAGGAADGGVIADPYGTPSVCTSKSSWARGNSGDQKMNPGVACINCHTMTNKGPKFAIAGTIFPTAHEPDLCNGGAVTTGARIVIVGGNGQIQTLTPNTAGNFSFQGTIAKPYTAKVTYMGRERAMLESQTSGDCNGCHTEAGAMKAPGRIMLP